MSSVTSIPEHRPSKEDASIVHEDSSETARDTEAAGEVPPTAGLMRRLSKAISMRLSFASRASQSHAYDDEEIPTNFLRASSTRMKAGRKWEATRKWRIENDIDHILLKPKPLYKVIKAQYPQFFHGRALNGDIISVEKPGAMNVKELKAAGVTPQAMAMHLAFTQEFLWCRVAPGDDARVVTIMDVSGFSLGKLTSTDLLGLIKATGDVLNNHYPDRVSKILVVNAPRFVGPALSVLKTVLPSPLRDQLEICRTVSDLEKFIDINVIPTDYGGKCPYKLGESSEEKALDALVEELNNPNGDSSN